MKLVGFWLLPLAIVLSACSNLGEIQPGVCGNGIVDPGEDCDGPGAGCGTLASDHPCRFVCGAAAGSSNATCPTGYGCGHDGVCRAATGSFAEPQALPGDQTVAFSVGDVDGDGNDDIVGVNQAGWIGVDYLDAGGLAATARSHSVQLPFALGQLTDGDTRADVAHLPGASVGVLTGGADRSLTPQAYAGFAVPASGSGRTILFTLDAAYVRPGEQDFEKFGGQEFLAWTGSLLFVPIANQNLFSVDEAKSTLAPRLAAGAVPTGNIDEREQTSPCDEFVLADQGSPEVSVYTPCSGPGEQWNTDPHAYPKVELPGGAKVGEGALLTRINPGDKHLDLVIASQPYPNPDPSSPISQVADIYVAFGVGDGTFNSTPPPVTTPDQTAALLFPGMSGLPLATGDLNGDGVDDFVFPDRVVESDLKTCAGCWTTVLSGEGWAQAQIADFNGNGIPDFVTVPIAGRYVEFFNGTGGPLFNKSEIQTNGYPNALTQGDFDGNLIPDIAVAEAGGVDACPGTDRSDSVSILFGNVGGPLGSPQSMGKLDCISQFVAGNFFFAAGVDWTSDLAALDVAADGSEHVALFGGSTARQLSAPFPLDSTDSVNSDLGISIQAGQFDSDKSHSDLAVLALDGAPPRKPRLWVLPSTGTANLENGYPAPNLDPKTVPLDVCSALTAEADFDGDGIDEMVLLGRSSKAGGLVAIAKVDPKTKELHIAATHPVSDVDLIQPSIFRFQCAVRRDPQNPGVADALDSTQVQVTDIDGKKQIVVLGAAGGSTPQSGHVLRAFSWQGAGHDIVESTITAPSGVDPLGFAVMNADADPGPEVVLVTIDGVFVSNLQVASDGSMKLGPLYSPAGGEPIAPNMVMPGIGIEGVIGVRPGDFNGDGVPDFVVGHQTGFNVYYGAPEVP